MTSADPDELMRTQVGDEQDVYFVRSQARQIAALAGLENQDQIRVATAVSELGRELATLPLPASVTFSLTGGVAPLLRVVASWTGRLGKSHDRRTLAAVEGIAAAARLSDGCTSTWRRDGGAVELIKKLPVVTDESDHARITRVRVALADRPVTHHGSTALETMRSQNHDLMQALEDLRARQQDLLQVNAELEETNQGVLALHAELSAELEQTNQGVVALYAELDEASSKLREASESKTRFWANISHELRTPINSVLGLSRLLTDPNSEPLATEQRRQVNLITDSATVLLSLVNELLDVAKAESGQTTPRPELTELRFIFDELRAAVGPLATNPDVELQVEPPEGIGPVWVDPTLLSRILRNLLSNGLKFTEAGHVRCEATRVNSATTGSDLVRLVVSDTGIGIAREHHRRVFEEFYQVPGRLQARTVGTGLGLPYARALIAVLGGSVTLDSEPGTGTTITVELPILPAADSTALTHGRVVVVEDDPAFREVILDALPAEADIALADSGPAALAALRLRPPDLVVLDLHIPPPDGAAILATMRADNTLARVPVVVVTSDVLDSETHRALSGSAAVLAKQYFSPTLLEAAVGIAQHLIGGAR